MGSVFSCEGVRKRRYGRVVVDNLSMDVGDSEVVGLLGANGCGKSTSLHIFVGILRQDCGRVFLCGEDVSGVAIHRRGLMGMGYLSQQSSLFSSLTVEENIMMLLEVQRGLSRREQREKLEFLLESFNLGGIARSVAGEISGGERRRVEIARALVTNPRVLFLDEPFANVDPLTIAHVKEIFASLVGEGISIVITDHNAKEVLSFADRSYVMNEGTVIASGDKDEIYRNPVVRRHYLGANFSL